MLHHKMDVIDLKLILYYGRPTVNKQRAPGEGIQNWIPIKNIYLWYLAYIILNSKK